MKLYETLVVSEGCDWECAAYSAYPMTGAEGGRMDVEGNPIDWIIEHSLIKGIVVYRAGAYAWYIANTNLLVADVELTSAFLFDLDRDVLHDVSRSDYELGCHEKKLTKALLRLTELPVLITPKG